MQRPGRVYSCVHGPLQLSAQDGVEIVLGQRINKREVDSGIFGVYDSDIFVHLFTVLRVRVLVMNVE